MTLFDAALNPGADATMDTQPTENPTTEIPTGFPKDFVFGSGTSSYQIEGAAYADGKTDSIWDVFCRLPGRIKAGDTGEVACDHYHRMPEDVALMAEMGLTSYRFSVSWPRVIPGGRGGGNTAGTDFYQRLVDELLGAGIEPVMTLYHWDLPAELQELGGWAARDTAYRFAEFGEHMVEAVGDRIALLTTLNEPWCSAFLGYAGGEHAPGLQRPADAFAAVHHLLLGHGMVVQAVRESHPQLPTSIVLNPRVVRPHSSGDQDAARRIDGLVNRMFIGPLFHREYPADVQADVADLTDFSFVERGDMDIIGSPIDVLGVNYYKPMTVASASMTGLGDAEMVGPTYPGSEDLVAIATPGPKTGQGWLIDPSGLVEVLERFGAEVPDVPLMVTENGSAFPDTVSADGCVHDVERTAYLRAHLHAVLEARARGVNVTGYFQWSLLDNFEWAWGYEQRFGIVHVDFDTQRRIIKESGRFYARVIAENREVKRN